MKNKIIYSRKSLIKKLTMQTTEMITRARWNIDPVHSTIGFKVKHLMVSNVRGEFKEYAASIYTKGEDFLSIEIDCGLIPHLSVPVMLQEMPI